VNDLFQNIQLVDVILISIFLLCVYSGARSGLVRAVSTLLVAVISLYLTMLAVSSWSVPLADRFITPRIETMVVEKLEEKYPGEGLEAIGTILSTSQKVVDKVTEMMGALSGSAEDSEVLPDSTDTTVQLPEEEPELTDVDGNGEINEADEYRLLLRNLCSIVGSIVMAVILFVLVFAVLYAILKTLVIQLDFIRRIPLVGPLNTLCGMLIGLAFGLFLIYLPIIVVDGLLPSLFGSEIVLIESASLKQSAVLRWLYGREALTAFMVGLISRI